jgi:hypothetical protein
MLTISDERFEFPLQFEVPEKFGKICAPSWNAPHGNRLPPGPFYTKIRSTEKEVRLRRSAHYATGGSRLIGLWSHGRLIRGRGGDGQ